MAQWLTETPSCRKLVLTSSVTALVLTSAVTVFTGTIPALAAATPATTTPGGADASAHAGRDARPRRVGVEPRKDRQGHNRSLLCRTCKLLPLVCATLRRLSCPSGGPIEHQRASEGSAGAARPCRRAAPRLSPVGGPNPSPHSGRLQVSSESTPPSVRVATGPAGHRGRDQALSPAGPSPRSTQTMRCPLEARRRDPSTSRLIKGHSRPTASSPMTFTGSPQLARRARRPRLPGAARHSLWLRLPAGTDCPFLK